LRNSAVLLAACAAVAGLGARPATAGTPVRGLSDDLAFVDSSHARRAVAFETARRAGARVAPITLDWSLVAPGGASKPSGFRAGNPSDRAYRWGYVEDAVRDAARAHLRVMLVVNRAPAWAEGPFRPASAQAGAWKPDPGELGAFIRAAARRFSGFYPDPKRPGDGLRQRGRALPRVRLWQLWETPNSGVTLQPAAGSADRYRRMLKAASGALRRVSRRNVLVTGATTDDGAVAPVRFWRRLLCRPGSGCGGRARFDVAAHRPSGRRPPGARPRGGFGLRGLRRLRNLAGRPVWVTGVAWTTPPLDPAGLSPARQARFLAMGLYLADRAGARLVAWNGLQDRRSYLRGFPSIASGLFSDSANGLSAAPPKPARRAYRFPFVVTGGHAWGIAPRGGAPVRIEYRGARSWQPVASVRASGSGEFSAPLSARGTYRAREGRFRSLPWTR
jgi:hypothetical protein